jgi:hypothetical protein
MIINEESKLIKQKKIYENNKEKNQEYKKNHFSFFSIKNIIINTIVLIIFLTFIIFCIIYYITENKPVTILKALLKEGNEIIPFPANESTKYSPSLLDEKNICSKNKKFIILRRTTCEGCGLFSYYIVHLGCIINYLKHGYIPILDVGSFTNVFTGYRKSGDNPWEEFFEQPCGYTLAQVVKMKNIQISECECVCDMPDEKTIYSNKIMWDYHHQIQEKYMSVKKNIYEEVDNIWHKLFGKSKNVLGILIRGTDYRANQPPEHSIQPSVRNVINDTITMNKQYKYDFIFLATEDNKIRSIFIKKIGVKLKYLLPKKRVYFDLDDGLLTYNKNVFGNMNFLKTYLYSVVILSRCIDIISSRTSGAAGAFILSKGYRNNLVYYLGEY